MKRSHVLFDVVVLAVYLLAANPALTGIPSHELIGLGAFIVVAAHFIVVAAHVIVSADGLGGRGRVGQLALNAVLLLSLAACVVSGVMVSGTVLPLMGLYASGYHFWDPLHAVAAKVLLAALLVHVVVRGPAALAVLRRRRDLRDEGGDCPA